MKSEHIAEMSTCSLQAACSTGDSTNDCKRLLDVALGRALPFLWGSLGSALSSCCVGGLIWIQCTCVEHPPPAIGSPGSSQKPAGRVAAPSCWSPVMSVHIFSNAGVGDGGQSKATVFTADMMKAQETPPPHCMCPPWTPTPLVIPLPTALPTTWSPFPWLCPDARGHPSLCK